MEFVPCPQCGAFNSSSLRECAECHASLPDEPPAPPAIAFAPAASAPAGDQEPTAVAEAPAQAGPPPLEAPPEVLAKAQQLETALAEKPSARALCLQLAQLYLDANRKDLAARAIERGLEVDPKNTYLRHRLAQITGSAAPLPAVEGTAPGARGTTVAFQPVQRPAPPATRPAPRADARKWKLWIGGAVAFVALVVGMKLWLFPTTRSLVAGAFRAHAPVWSPTGRHLAFLMDDDKGTRLGIYDFSKAAFRTVGPVAAWDSHAISWSPDGTRLAYAAAGGEDDWQQAVFTVDVSGGPPKRIATGSSPAWANDGRTLVMVCPPEGSPSYNEEGAEPSFDGADWSDHYCRVNVAEGQVQRLPLMPTYGAALSALHEAVVFERAAGEPQEAGDATASASVGDFDGLVDAVAVGGARNVAEGSRDLSRELEARQYTQRRAAAMTAERIPYAADLFVASLAGGQPVSITSDHQSAFPSWTADGDRILFATNGAAGLEFCTVGANGSGRQTVLSGVRGVDPQSVTISPDGERVFFVASVPGDAGMAKIMTGESPADLHVARVGSKTARRLANRHPFKQRYAVSPDGKRIAYEVMQDVKLIGGARKSELWLLRW